jgi:magnesium-transporting ATPase (P-type)
VLNFIDGLVIIVVVLLISGITAVNNYVKELQFCNLQSKQDDSRVTVRRPAGVIQISVNAVLVGDVVQLDTGSKIPAGSCSCYVYITVLSLVIQFVRIRQMASLSNVVI